MSYELSDESAHELNVEPYLLVDAIVYSSRFQTRRFLLQSVDVDISGAFVEIVGVLRRQGKSVLQYTESEPTQGRARTGPTQIGRTLQELGIELIAATGASNGSLARRRTGW